MSRAGATLIELLVALLVLGVSLGVAVVAIGDRAPAADDGARTALSVARRQAVAARHAVRFTLPTDSGDVEALALPDGRVVTRDTLPEPMSGRPRAR